jgi:crotonobetainyl-CoA:carnitine CoA-transferase CaiB-like acyl-CoA transferase
MRGGAVKPLSDILVVELGDRTSAGACGTLLAHLGADVVLVEHAAVPAEHKWVNRPVVAAGKRSVVRRPGGARDDDLLRRVIAAADVLLLSSDLSHEDRALWEGYPPAHRVSCDFTAFGHTGPLAGKAFPDELVQGYCGVADTNGHREGSPAITGAPFVSMEAGAYGAAAILAALHNRERTGRGQRIDVALFDVGLNAVLTFVPLVQVGRTATRNGNRHPGLFPWNSFRARDGSWVLICAPTDDQWRRLCKAMERPDLAADPRFTRTTDRMNNVEALDREIAAWVAVLDSEDVVRRVNAVAVPASSIETLDSIHREPNVLHRGMSAEARDPADGRILRVPGNPLGGLAGSGRSAPSIPAADADRSWLARRLRRPPVRNSGRRLLAGAGGALQGVRVVEIGMNTVAPLAGRQLGALGADVIKVEPPTGDTNRHNAPLRGDGISYGFMMSNTDKRGVVLDLQQEEDRERLFDLLATADAVIENLKPGSLDRLGVGADAVLKRLPHLAYCSVNGFGFDTVYPNRPALDTVVQAMSGAMDANEAGGMPTKAGLSISDQIGGQLGLVAILAALFQRARGDATGHIDLAMQDGSVWSTAMRWNGAPQPRERFAVVAAADGYVIVEGNAAQSGNIAGMTRDQAVAAFAAEGVAAAPVLTVAEALAHGQTKARKLYLTVPTPEGHSFEVMGCPMRLLATPPAVTTTMGALGYPYEGLEEELRQIAMRRLARKTPAVEPQQADA